MRLELTGHHVDITPPLRQLIERKLSKFDRLLNDAALSAQVICKIEKYRHVVDVTIHTRGDHMLHGQGEGASWQAAAKEAGEKIDRQAHSLKERWHTRKRRAVAARQLAAAEVVATGAADVPPRIIRASRYAVRPLTPGDAARKLQGTEDGFIVFRNSDTDEVNVVYKRKDGRFGLIEPEA
jgi:putative sigma-54 modulation protein